MNGNKYLPKINYTFQNINISNIDIIHTSVYIYKWDAPTIPQLSSPYVTQTIPPPKKHTI